MKKRLQHRCFAVNFAKFLRTPFLQNTSGRLHLIMRPLFFIQFVTCGTRTVWSIHFDQHFGTRLNPLFDQVFGNLVCIYRIILCLSSFAVIQLVNSVNSLIQLVSLCSIIFSISNLNWIEHKFRVYIWLPFWLLLHVKQRALSQIVSDM